MRFLSVFFILISFQAKAEYRAFLLQISNADKSESKQVKSTLDPDQYRGYFHLQEGETIVYVDTWMCKGRTSLQAICPSPRELAPEAAAPDSP